MSSNYAIFCEYRDDRMPGLISYDDMTLDECLQDFATNYAEWWAPVAWVADDVYRSELSADAIRAESIAAGRLIEKTASGWVALGAEKQEHFCNRDVPEGFWDFPKPELRKGEPSSVDLNAAMIARDGPAKPAATKHFLDCPECGYGPAYCQCKHAKPNPFQNYTAPDCDSGPSDHLNASRHQMAGMKG